MSKNTTVTIKDVARRAGVSIATVSYAFNKADVISEETRERVFAAAKALGYRANIVARNLRMGQSRTLGYTWHNVPASHWHPVLDRFLYGMAEAAEAQGYHILTFSGGRQTDDWHPYEELVQMGRVDGFILSDTDENDARIRFLMDRGFPFVSFGRANPEWDFPYVDVDGESGLYDVVRHLMGLGHRRIGLIAWPPGSVAGAARVRGYERACVEADVPVDPAWLVRVENEVADARCATRQLLALPASRRPTAIATVSDLLALGVMQELSADGLRPGQDVAVVGFDDIPTAQYMQPPLSSVRQPIAEVGERVITMLLALVRGETLPERHVLLAPELIIRASSGGPVA